MTSDSAGLIDTPAPAGPRQSGAAAVPYASAALTCLAITAVAAPLSRTLDLANVVMLYPLAVFLVAFRLGRGPAVVSAFLSVALFDFFLVPPYYSFAVADVQYLLTFAVMLVVALVTAHLTARLKQQAAAAARSEERTRALFEMARILAGVHTLKEIEETIAEFVAGVVHARALMLLYDAHGKLASVTGDEQRVSIDPAMAALAAGTTGFTDIDTPFPVRYEPMATPSRRYGVLAFIAPSGQADPLAEEAELLEAVASLAAISVERIRYAQAAMEEQARPIVERLQRAYAALLAYDLRQAAMGIEALRKVVEDSEAERILPQGWSQAAAQPGDVRKELADSLERLRNIRFGEKA